MTFPNKRLAVLLAALQLIGSWFLFGGCSVTCAQTETLQEQTLAQQPSDQANANESDLAFAENPDATDERLKKILKPFLWRIKNDANPDKPSWLFGTIHITDDRVLEMHPAARAAFHQADTLFLEVSPKDMLKQLKVLMLEDDQKPEDLIDADTLKRLDAQLEQISPILAGRLRAKYKVWVWPIVIPSIEAQLRNSRKMILDVELAAKAKRAGKPVGGLEDPSTQLDGMDALTPDEQIAFLKDWLDSAEEAAEEDRDPEAEMAEIYVSGDMQKLETYINSDMVSEQMSDELSEKILNAMLYTRNQTMADTILKTLKEQPDRSHFFAAGTAHFAGEKGVQNLLRKQMIEVERVKGD